MDFLKLRSRGGEAGRFDAGYPALPGQARRFRPAPRTPSGWRAARFELICKPGGSYFERRTAEGRHLEFRFIPLPNGDTIAVDARHHRAEGARGCAGAIQGIGRTGPRHRRARARRGGSRDPGQVDLPRHHEPRDPHADERRARHDGGARAPGPRRGTAQERRDHARLRAGAAAHHRRPARLLQDRGRPAGAGGHRVLAVRADRRRGRHVPAAGRRQGAVARSLDRGRLERRAGRRSDPGAADPVQPSGQRAEIHQARRRHGARRHRAARPGRDARDAFGERHRHRADRGAARAPVPAVRAGRFLDHAALRRHRPRPLDRAPAYRADGRLGGNRTAVRAPARPSPFR